MSKRVLSYVREAIVLCQVTSINTEISVVLSTKLSHLINGTFLIDNGLNIDLYIVLYCINKIRLLQIQETRYLFVYLLIITQKADRILPIK